MVPTYLLRIDSKVTNLTLGTWKVVFLFRHSFCSFFFLSVFLFVSFFLFNYYFIRGIVKTGAKTSIVYEVPISPAPSVSDNFFFLTVLFIIIRRNEKNNRSVFDTTYRITRRSLII